MHCNKCNSDWNTDKPVSVCPFCGASLADKGSSEPSIYDNSKDALAHIMRVHGADVLLGSTLKNYFTDYAPGVEGARKHVIISMSASGAAVILQRKIAANAGEQEIAFRQAVQKIIDAYGTERSLVESVVLEFTDALGWKINIQTQAQREISQNKPMQQKPLQDQQKISERPQRQQMPSKTAQTQQAKPATQQKPKRQKRMVGQRYVGFGGYNWRVLDVQNGKVLLLTEDVIEMRRYHSSCKRITWEECELRGYLNGVLQTFNSSEQSRIASVTNTNSDNPWYGTQGGRGTTDKVFLLSIDEVVKYFGDSGDLRTGKGWYFGSKPFALRDGKGYLINDQYNEVRIAKYGNKKAWWWLRSSGKYGDFAAFVDSDGCLSLNGSYVNRSVGGVRPALWLNL